MDMSEHKAFEGLASIPELDGIPVFQLGMSGKFTGEVLMIAGEDREMMKADLASLRKWMIPDTPSLKPRKLVESSPLVNCHLFEVSGDYLAVATECQVKVLQFPRNSRGIAGSYKLLQVSGRLSAGSRGSKETGQLLQMAQGMRTSFLGPYGTTGHKDTPVEWRPKSRERRSFKLPFFAQKRRRFPRL